ncbi:MAG: BatA domain-containing protein [bacterium]|nr:BatA domain-containing protein [bacterium]
MFFSNSYFLFGLAFVIIPILIHFLTKKQIIVIKFPSLLFIKKTFEKESKKIRFKELLLLLIRTLVILFLVLSLAKPFAYLKDRISQMAFEKNRNKSIVFVLDNTFSMGAISEGENLFLKAKRMIFQIIEKTAGPQDDFSLLLSTDTDDIQFLDLSHDKKEIIRVVKDAGLSYLNNNLFETLKKAEQLLDKSSHSQRLIYLLSDMQRINFQKDSDYIHQDARSRYPLFFIKISSPQIKNSAVIEDTIPIRLNFLKDTVPIYAMVKNFSSVQNNIIVKTTGKKESVHQKSISLAPHEKISLNYNYSVDTTGTIPFCTQIVEGDDLSYDNQHYFILSVPPKVRIISLDPGKELTYVLNSLNPAYLLNKNNSSPVQIQEMNSLEPELDFDMMLFNFSRESTDDLASLKNYIQRNKNLVLFLSPHLDINSFNLNFIKIMNLNCSISERHEENQKPFSIEYLDYSHPIFTLFKDIKIFGTSKIFSYYSMNVDRLAPGIRILARFNNQDPAILEIEPYLSDSPRRSRILLFTFLPAKDTTDFIYDPNFPPLMQQVMKYLLNTGLPDEYNRFYIGQSLQDIHTLLDSRVPKLTQLMGEEEAVKDNRIVKPGIFQVDEKIFAVNPDYTESDITPIGMDELVRNYRNLPIKTAENQKEITDKIFHYSSTRPLGKIFLFLVLLLLILEVLVSQGIGKFIPMRTK